MTIVVSDTSPIRALDFLNLLEALPILFDTLLIPPAVGAELLHTGGRFRLIDEADGRQVAQEKYGLRTIGTLGILLTARQRVVVPAVRSFIDQLRDGLGFFVSESLYQEVLRRASETE